MVIYRIAIEPSCRLTGFIEMLKLQYRPLFTSTVAKAAAPARGKAQGFAKKAPGNRAAAKRITGDTLYKNWADTVSFSKLNQYALPTEIPTFNPKELASSLNKVSSYSNKHYRSLYHLGSFHKNQFNELFPKPVSLIRQDSIGKLINLLQSGDHKTFVLTGEPGVGKSTLLAQVHAFGCDSNSIIVHISYPALFLNGRSDFFYDDKLKEYVQPMYMKKLLRKILKSNDENILRSLKLISDYKFPNADPKDSAIKKHISLVKGQNTLFDLLSIKTLGRNRGELFKAVISELAGQKTHPVLFTVDNFSRILTGPVTEYKDADNKNISIFEFQLGKTILGIVSGEISFPNKNSACVLAISGVDRTNRTLPVGLGKIPEDVYIKRYYYDPQMAEILKKGKVQEFEVPKLSKEEVRELLDFYFKSEILLESDSQNNSLDKLTDEKYFLSGNGNPRDLLKSIVLMHT